jgi:hypothetical protein
MLNVLAWTVKVPVFVTRKERPVSTNPPLPLPAAPITVLSGDKSWSLGLSAAEPIRRTTLSPALAENVHKLVSPIVRVPEEVIPLLSAPWARLGGGLTALIARPRKISHWATLALRVGEPRLGAEKQLRELMLEYSFTGFPIGQMTCGQQSSSATEGLEEFIYRGHLVEVAAG